MDCDIADSKQCKYVNQELQSEHPQPSETLERILDGTSGTVGTNGTNGTNEMIENEYDVFHPAKRIGTVTSRGSTNTNTPTATKVSAPITIDVFQMSSNVSKTETLQVFSVAHERASHDHHTTTRLQPTRKGLAHCSHITPDVTTPPWVPARTSTVHGGPVRGKAVGGPQQVPQDDLGRTAARQRQALRQTCDTTTRCSQTPGWNLTKKRSSAVDDFKDMDRRPYHVLKDLDSRRGSKWSVTSIREWVRTGLWRTPE